MNFAKVLKTPFLKNISEGTVSKNWMKCKKKICEEYIGNTECTIFVKFQLKEHKLTYMQQNQKQIKNTIQALLYKWRTQKII